MNWGLREASASPLRLQWPLSSRWLAGGWVFQAFKSSEEVRERFVQAYELMLGFYGIQLEDRDTGQVRRAQNYQKRFQNLNR